MVVLIDGLPGVCIIEAASAQVAVQGQVVGRVLGCLPASAGMISERCLLDSDDLHFDLSLLVPEHRPLL